MNNVRKQIPKGSVLILGETRYKIGEVIGQGGSGLIYEAVTEDAGHSSFLRYAIKELYPANICYRNTSWNIVPDSDDAKENEEVFRCYRQNAEAELEISQKVYSDNFRVVPVHQVYDTAQLEIHKENRTELFHVTNTYSIMFNAAGQGQTLSDYLKGKKRPLPLKQSINIMLSVCSLYAKLHQNYIHADVQAGNIYLMGLADCDCDPTAVLLDFGSSMKLDRNCTAQKRSYVFSSDGYCPPEFIFDSGEPYYTPAVDVYGLGYLFLSLVKNSPWLHPEQRRDITYYFMGNPSAKRVLDGEAIGITDPETFALLNHIIQKAMNTAPKERYKNAAHLLEALYELRDCYLLSIDHGLRSTVLRHAAFAFIGKNEGNDCSLVPSPFPLYCVSDGKKIPVAEYLRQKAHNIKLLHAPIGSGKTTAISQLYMHILHSTKDVPLLIDADDLLTEFWNKEGYETVMYAALAKHYLPHIEKQAAIRALRSYLESQPKQEYIVLIIENLHRIEVSQFSQQAYAAINALFSRCPHIQMIATANQEPNTDKIHFDCISALEPIDDETLFTAIETATNKNSQNRHDYITIKEQAAFLRRPFFLLRYLELIRQNQRLSLPDSAPNLLAQYFLHVLHSQEDTSLQAFSRLDILSEIGYLLFINQGVCSLETLSHATNIRKEALYHMFSSSSFLREVITLKDSQCRFSNEVYTEYFASVYISTCFIRACRARSPQPLKLINHREWPLAWISVLEGSDYNDIPMLLASLQDLMTEETCHISIHIATYFNRKEDDNAYLRWLAIGAQVGSAAALSQLGAEYMRGRITSKDLSKAKDYLQQAVQKHDRTALYNLALLYDRQENYHQAMRLFQQAAEAGDVDAMNNLAYMYGMGRGCIPDHNMAVRYLQEAAERGSSIALYNLARRYYYGIGVGINSNTAEQLMILSAEQDYPPAIKQLVNWYTGYGRMIDPDEEKSTHWMNRAIRVGLKL